MSLLGACLDYDEWAPAPQLSALQERAWELYCADTAGGMDVRDFWQELPTYVQGIYLRLARGES